MDLRLRPIVSAVAVGLIGAGSVNAQEVAPGGAPVLAGFDFTQPGAVAEWQPAHDVSGLAAVVDGMVIRLDGGDPFIIGPPRDYPADLPVRMTLRIRPAVDGHVQVFFFRDHAREDRSVSMSVRGGMWNEVQALLPPLGPAARLRIDPPGRTGDAVVARLVFEPAASLPAPHWPAHRPPDIGSGRRLESGSLAVEVTSRGFAVEVNGVRSAASHSQPVAGYLVADGSVRWVALSAADWTVDDAAGDVARAIVAEQSIRDPDGGTWRFRRRFTAGREPGTIDVEVVAHVDVDRQVAFLPLLLLVAHEGTPRKRQGVFPGLEYLADEPSSSEADMVGPPSRRQVPTSHTITFPLMAVAHAGRLVGLAWDHEAAFAAVFDSPDRLLGSGGHLLGVVAPGSTGLNRSAGSPMPIDPMRFKAGTPLTLRATLLAAAADTVVPAIRAAVRWKGLPPVPDAGSFDSYVRLAAAGWLDSGIREHGRYRHAIGANFQAQPAADAAVFTAWLAGHAAEPVAGRLREASVAAAAVPRGSFDAAVIGHVRQPVQSLVLGRVEDALAEHAVAARRRLAAVRPDGTVAYRPGADGVDYGRTNAADHACGLSASTVADAIEAARFAGNAGLIDEAVVAVRRLARAYAGGVPRGGQTWEIPLHTPDVMASAHMVRALTIGHELTGDPDLLEQAVAWAWTGVPFIYLVDPVGTDDGPYGCVTVFGATGWTAPVWIGRPVQWCGLVYAHALYRLARHDPTGPWRHLADGITATGIRYSWPAAGPASGAADGARQGLLPDGWDVREGIRLDPPINPGTLQACAVELFRKGPLLDCRVLPFAGGRMIVHAPGAIELAHDRPPDGELSVRVSGWPRAPYAVLVTGLPTAPGVMIDGRDIELVAPHRFDPVTGRLVLHLDAARLITFRQPPPPTP